MIRPMGRVALTASFPVEVFMKSAPAIIDTIDAMYTCLTKSFKSSWKFCKKVNKELYTLLSEIQWHWVVVFYLKVISNTMYNEEEVVRLVLELNTRLSHKDSHSHKIPTPRHQEWLSCEQCRMLPSWVAPDWRHHSICPSALGFDPAQYLPLWLHCLQQIGFLAAVMVVDKAQMEIQ